MRLVDAGIDDRDLDTGASVLHASERGPCSRRVDELRCTIQIQPAPA